MVATHTGLSKSRQRAPICGDPKSGRTEIVKRIHQSTIITILAGAVAFALPSLASTNDLWSKVSNTKVGQSRQDVREIMKEYKTQAWNELTTSFNVRLGFLAGVEADAWLVDASTLDTEGGRTYIIAIYSKNETLIDFLVFRAAAQLRPILTGEYAKRLESITTAMNVDDIYRLLGQEKPYRYYRDGGTKKWRVELVYQGVGKDMWVYVADAATGAILETHVSSI